MSRTSPRLTLLAVLVLLVAMVPSGSVFAAKPPGGKPSANKVVLFASDGMRPDLMEKYAGEGLMPTYASLMAQGVKGVNGMMPAFPPNTGVGWYTMATGAYPADHGSTNNTYFRLGDAWGNRTSFSGSTPAAQVLQADTIAEAAERAGKKVAQIDWVGGAQASLRGLAGPTVDFTNFFSGRGVLAAPLNTTEQAGAAAFGVSYIVASFAPAAGWANVPVGDPAAPAQQTTLTIATTFAAQNPSRTYDIYIYDSDVNGIAAYDHAILLPTVAAKDFNWAGAGKVALGVGDFKEVKLSGADGLIGPRAGQSAGFYTKLITLAPDLSSFKLYFTSVQRVIAFCGTAACAGLAGGNLENYLADNMPTSIAADFAPLEARIIDEETYVQQGLDLHEAYAAATTNFILGTLQPNTDLAMVGFPTTDEFSHQFMALYTPTDMDGDPNPCFDDLECGGAADDGRTTEREDFVRSAYHGADSALAQARTLMGGNPTTFAGSDHGFAAQWYAVNARKVLFDTSVDGISLHASGANTASNCGGVPLVLAGSVPNQTYVSGDLTKACWAGGAIQIYIQPTLPAGTTNAEIRQAVKDAFNNLDDPANPGEQIVLTILDKEQLRNVDGSDSLHPNRSGDLVVVLRPPYQSDAGTPGTAVALSQFFGQHGYLPDLVDLAHNVNMHATFVAAGPGIRKQADVAGLRQVDIAPTISFLMGFPGPQNARGKILYNLLVNGGQMKEVTILDISDYHGQLVPLSEVADLVPACGTACPTFPLGGSNALESWFDVYRAEATNGSLTVAAGDSVGATPPISAFFGDTPTIDLMNLMGFGADGLGNHNFDKGSAYLRNTLIPLANYPFLSANVVDNAGKTPAQWKPSATFATFGGLKLGLVGFTNDDAPTLVFPNAFDPFHVANSLTSVNAEVANLKSKGAFPIIAMGHLGATGGTLTQPTGPLVDFVDGLVGVDAVIGDHSNQQVLATRPNGVLVVENLSKGVRFTRVRVVVDASTKAVVYKTADFHKPWTVGTVNNPEIQSEIDDLNAQLQPILGTVIGQSTVEVLRSDVCGRADGRLCESLVGDVTTDAMRDAYTSIGVEFAITNSGGLRAALTCPAAGTAGFCPAPGPTPPFPITRGSVLGVLPFGNVVATVTINGAELKAMLENGVSTAVNGSPPFGLGANGRFPQVSGLCFTYNIEATAGSRVTGAVRQALDGSCTGAAIDLTAGSSYKIAENDFMASGGDGYPVFTGKSGYATQNILDQVLADFVTAHTPISPAIQARIHCFDPNPGSGAACTTGSP